MQFKIVILSFIFSGLPQNVQLGLGTQPGGSYEKIGQMCNLSTEEVREMEDHAQALAPIVRSKELFQILLLLILTELNESGSALKFRNSILTAIFRIESNSGTSDEQILGPYFEMVHRIKEIYKKGKTFFDMFCQ